MKPLKSIYRDGITLEILKLSETRYIVRKRNGSSILAIKETKTLDLATRYFDFIKP